jgi:hypothetical protein
MRKLLRERSVCAPHSLSEAMSSAPKLSLSLRVLRGDDVRRDLAMMIQRLNRPRV